MNYVKKSLLCFMALLPFVQLHSAANSAHSYQGKAQNVFNMAAQLYGTGSGGAVTIPVPVYQGGTGDTSLTAHGVLIGNGTDPVTVSNAGTTGTVLIGNTSADPSFTDYPTVREITISDAPVLGTDGTNKDYVDLVAAGLHWQVGVVAASTANLTATYNNVSVPPSGVGATLTNAGAMAAISLDGVSPTVGQRVLIKNQASQLQNGIYTVTTVGSGATNWVLTRATDYDTITEISVGDVVPVTGGTTQSNTLWIETAAVTSIGVSPIIFSQFLQQGIVTLTGDTGSATGTTVSITGLPGGNITTAASGSAMTIAVSGTTNHAVQVGNATGSLTSVGVGTTNTVLLGNTGADPSFGQVPNGALVNSSITLNNGNNITVTGSPVSLGGAATINVSGTTQYNVQVGNATGSLSSVAPGTAGIPLVSTGAASNPAFSTALVVGGGTGLTSMTAYAVLCGGTTSTAALQQVSGLGTAGQVLTSSGAAALPVWANGAAITTSVTLTGTQVTALNGTPVLVVTGVANNIIYIINAMVQTLTTTAFASAGTIDLIYGSPSVNTIISGLASTAFMQTASVGVMGGVNGGQTAITAATLSGVGVYVQNPNTQFTAGPGGSNALKVTVSYILVSVS